MNLIGTLQQGVPTGAIGSIPYSGVFHFREPSTTEELQFVTCEGNWSNAEHDPATTQQLIEEEVSAGFAYELLGGMQEARDRWGTKLPWAK